MAVGDKGQHIIFDTRRRQQAGRIQKAAKELITKRRQ
jgi:hypothetical protein